jgi:hypothetical protein
MTDQPPTNYEQVSLEEAALRLGITVNAVRQRLKRGTLIGVKTPDGWLVDWRPTTNEADSRSSANQPTITGGHRPTTTDHAAIEAIGVLRDLLTEERTALAEERAKIERLVEATTYWQSRANQAEEELKQLTAGDVPDDEPEPRVELPTASPAGQGEEIAPKTTAVTLQSPPVVESVKWWQVWKR